MKEELTIQEAKEGQVYERKSMPAGYCCYGKLNLATGISNAAMPMLMYGSPPSWHDQGLYGDAETK